MISAIKVWAFINRGPQAKGEVQDIEVLAPDFLRHRIFPVEPLNYEDMDDLIREIVKKSIEVAQHETTSKAGMR